MTQYNPKADAEQYCPGAQYSGFGDPCVGQLCEDLQMRRVWGFGLNLH